jgi:phage head maturation protease
MTAETVTVPVEFRSVDEAQRLAVMLVCRYGETSRRTPKPERFVSGAFTRSVTERGHRIAFTDAHTGGTGVLKRPAVARPVAWDTSDPLELRATLRYFDSSEGWEAFCRARDGEIDAGSVGFRAVEERTAADGVREVTLAQLHHVALLARSESLPAYDAPRLLEVRESDVARLEAAERLLKVAWDPALAEQASYDALARLGRSE